MNYTILDSYKSDLNGNITTKSSHDDDVNITSRYFCTFYYKHADPFYKSQYCHHVEPLEVALKTVGKSM